MDLPSLPPRSRRRWPLLPISSNATRSLISDSLRQAANALAWSALLAVRLLTPGQSDSEVAVELCRVSLRDHDLTALQQFFECSVEGPECNVEAGISERGREHVSPPEIAALPTWLPPSVQKSEHASFRSAVRFSQTRSNSFIDDNPIPRSRSACDVPPGRRERAVRRDLDGQRGNRVEVPPCSKPELGKQGREALDSCNLGVGFRDPDWEVESDENRRTRGLGFQSPQQR